MRTAVAPGRHEDPFGTLGPHLDEATGGIVLRALQPAARTIDVRLMATGDLRPMRRRDRNGLFELALPGDHIPDYRLRITYTSGQVIEIDDPYRYGRILTEFDLHLFGEGTHLRAFEKFGAHRLVVGTTVGVHFAVWAPNADRVSLIGDFNGWDGRVHVMRLLAPAGVWEIFIPDLADGEKYKFEIRTKAGHLLNKTDPFGVAFESPPRTASVVRDISRYQWGDQSWMTGRRECKGWLDRPMAIYEVHLGSWARAPEDGDRFLTYREMAHRLVPYVKDLGFTHIELLPVMEHPFSGSWGSSRRRAVSVRPRISSCWWTRVIRRGWG